VIAKTASMMEEGILREAIRMQTEWLL